jgi:hypothetical protein
VLDRLLSLLTGGGVHTPATLAAQLGVSEALLEHMLDDLARMGYVRLVQDQSCMSGPDTSNPTAPAAHCAGCPMAGACAVRLAGGRVWTLTDKAVRYRRSAPAQPES